MTCNNQDNQLLALKLGVIKPLVDLLDVLKSRNMTVQLKVAMALESLAINNKETQEAIVALGADIYMIKLCEVFIKRFFLIFHILIFSYLIYFKIKFNFVNLFLK